jgi:hypothetical protein
MITVIGIIIAGFALLGKVIPDYVDIAIFGDIGDIDHGHCSNGIAAIEKRFISC